MESENRLGAFEVSDIITHMEWNNSYPWNWSWFIFSWLKLLDKYFAFSKFLAGPCIQTLQFFAFCWVDLVFSIHSHSQ